MSADVGFTEDQKQYLEGFIAGVANKRGIVACRNPNIEPRITYGWKQIVLAKCRFIGVRDKSAKSVKMVTYGAAGRAPANPSYMGRLKLGIKETTMSGLVRRQ